MEQNITNDPDWKKLMAQMPQLPNGGNMGGPKDLGLGVPSTLSVPQMQPQVPQEARGVGIFQGAVSAATDMFNQKIAPIQTGIKAGAGSELLLLTF